MNVFTKSEADYKLIDGTERQTHRNRNIRSTINSVFTLCTGLLSLVLVFWLGRWSATETTLVPVSLIANTFTYNRDFSYPPSNRTDAAWSGLFPSGGGFFSHPPAITTRSTLSVFHQLHCLDAIRHAYWTLHDAATAGELVNDEDFPMHTSPSHVRHCTDLIRQSLMCNADLTLEVKDEMGGVSGFGTEKKCVDYDGLVRIVEGWQEEERTQSI